jgi:predicted DNA-binding transcriptional regulator YafY
VTRLGATNFDLTILFGPVTVDEQGEGLIETELPTAELDFYARHLLPLGTELVVESPPELIGLMRVRTQEIAALYSG